MLKLLFRYSLRFYFFVLFVKNIGDKFYRTFLGILCFVSTEELIFLNENVRM